MTRRHLRALIALCLLAAHAAASERPLPAVLDALRAGGLPLVYSSALVRDAMLVRAPDPGATRAQLAQLLAPHGLRLEDGPAGRLLVVAARPAADPAAAAVGVVSHIGVVSDRVEDVSSIAAWRASVIRPGMSERDKALAVWETVVRFRHQDAPPNDFRSSSGHPHDPIECFNVYGYGQCCCASANVQALARAVGLEARGWGIIAHSVPEVRVDGAWRLLDASLITYFPKADGSLAGVEEISAGVAAWNAARGGALDDQALRAFMRDQGWKRGPPLLAASPFYDRNGWLPAATHGWYATMQEYAEPAKCFVYEYGCAQGYEVNVQLRAGERLVRDWANRRLHVNRQEGQDSASLAARPGTGDLRYSPARGDLAPGRIGNGTATWEPSLADGGFRAGALSADNLAGSAEDGRQPALHVARDGAPGVLVLRMPSSYVYLDGAIAFEASVGAGGAIEVELSLNHGLDWTSLARVAASGAQRLALAPHIHRRYDYRVRLTLRGPGTGLDRLRLEHDVQHSQRALPALAKGVNTITVRAADELGTITVFGGLDPANAGRNALFSDFHPRLEGVAGAPLRLAGGSGSITVPIAVPGDLVRLRIGCHYRARDARDGWDVEASYDGGASFVPIGRCPGPVAGHSVVLASEAVPAGCRAALVRLTGQQRNTTALLDLRIDADYREPRGGFAPLRTTYVWEEGGKEQRRELLSTQREQRFTIDCAAEPVMRSLVVERAP